MLEAKHISVSIDCSPSTVYDFACDAENLPKWAQGLSGITIKKEGDAWVCDSPMGAVRVKFAPRNKLGVMDHEVRLPSGEVNLNPFRVLSNGEGSEVVFTLFRLPRMSEKEFQDDANMIKADLHRLKAILEGLSCGNVK